VSVDIGISKLRGVTLARVDVDPGMGSIAFVADDGRRFLMHHKQDCCESVAIEDIVGDTADLIGSPILLAEERCNDDAPPSKVVEDSWTWTFYELRTVRASVTIRWFGESNGYYSERVDFSDYGMHKPIDGDTWTVAADFELTRGRDDLASRYRTYFRMGGR
jgi:hypothetical protein